MGQPENVVNRMTHALALHRSKQDEIVIQLYADVEALRDANENIAEAAPEAAPILQLTLALAHSRLTHAAQAKTCLDEARRLIQEAVGSNNLEGELPSDAEPWLRCRILLREAEAAIHSDPNSPADR